MGNDEKTSEQGTNWTHENETVLRVLKIFLERRTHESESAAADRQKELSNELHTIKRKSLQGTSGRLVDGKIQHPDKLTVRPNQQGKCWKVSTESRYSVQNDVSQGIAPMKSESGYFFENSEKTKWLMETFYTGSIWQSLTSLTLSSTRSTKIRTSSQCKLGKKRNGATTPRAAEK